jgi:hypothetical protein
MDDENDNGCGCWAIVCYIFLLLLAFACPRNFISGDPSSNAKGSDAAQGFLTIFLIGVGVAIVLMIINKFIDK